jgi:hypothetical protein
MLFNKRALILIFSFLTFISLSSFALSVELNQRDGSEDFWQEIVESKTGFSGWRYQRECHHVSENMSYKLRIYSPPKRKDVGGYGVLATMYKSEEKIYSGYEFYPFAGGSGCDFIHVHDGGLLIVLDSENWALSKRYIMSVDVQHGEVSGFSYDLKSSSVFKTDLSDGSYLVSGFGLCPVGGNGDWVSDLFCKKVSVDTYKTAEITLEDAVGMKLSPEIPAIGKGAFKFYVLSVGAKKYDEGLVNECLSLYLDYVIENVKLLKGLDSMQAYYSSLLAIDSVGLVSSTLGKKFKIEDFSGKDPGAVEIAFKSYWNTVFNNTNNVH